MNYQPSFSQAEFADKKKITRREKFLTRMESLIPWTKLLAVIEQFYPKGERGRPPIGLERMLRVYFLQQWYGLADEALEDALYDSQSLQGFARIDLVAEGVPDVSFKTIGDPSGPCSEDLFSCRVTPLHVGMRQQVRT